MRAHAGVVLAIGALLVMCGIAHAGPWVVRDAASNEWQLAQDSNGDEAYYIERRTADKKPDPRFGDKGRAAVRLGPDDDVPAAMRVDAQGRVWVLGTTQDVGESRPSVLRLLPTGAPDPAWGSAGHSAATPAKGDVSGYDLLPLPDGSALVAGDVQHDDGEDRASLWRLRPDGSIDPKFSPQGFWQRSGPESAHAVALAEGPPGVYGIAAVVMQGAEPWIEVHANKAGTAQFTLALRERVAADASGEYHLRWEAGRWQIRTGRGVVEIGRSEALGGAQPEVNAGAAASGPETSGHAALIPFAESTTPAAANAPADEDSPYLWAAIAGAMVAGVGWFVYRRKSTDGDKP